MYFAPPQCTGGCYAESAIQKARLRSANRVSIPSRPWIREDHENCEIFLIAWEKSRPVVAPLVQANRTSAHSVFLYLTSRHGSVQDFPLHFSPLSERRNARLSAYAVTAIAGNLRLAVRTPC